MASMFVVRFACTRAMSSAVKGVLRSATRQAVSMCSRVVKPLRPMSLPGLRLLGCGA